jgi:hypothetical protein
MTRPHHAAALAVLAGLATALAATAGRNTAQDKPPAKGDKAGPKIEAKADQALKEMSKYLAGLKTFAIAAEESFDEVLDTRQKLQFSNRRKVVVSRPNKIASEFEGDAGSRLFYYDGSVASMVDRDKKSYGTFPFPRKPSIDTLLDLVNERFGLTIPLADFVFSDPYKVLTESVETGDYVGLHFAAGVKCHHLAFTQTNIDWQVWIDAGAKPQPRKFVITYKQLPGEPQFVATIGTLDPDPKIDDGTFRFNPPKDFTQLKLLDRPGLKKDDKP